MIGFWNIFFFGGVSLTIYVYVFFFRGVSQTFKVRDVKVDWLTSKILGPWNILRAQHGAFASVFAKLIFAPKIVPSPIFQVQFQKGLKFLPFPISIFVPWKTVALTYILLLIIQVKGFFLYCFLMLVMLGNPSGPPPKATFPLRNSRPYDQGLWKPIGFP